MNLICITESELAQWVSRHYLDALTARVLINQDEVTSDVFCTSPYLKLEDARGRIIVNLKENWNTPSSRVKTIQQDLNVVSISRDAIVDIAPAMDQYKKRLATYQLPIAEWSAEKGWDEWLINQAVIEVRRAIVTEINKLRCVDRKILDDENLLNALIKKSLRPKASSDKEPLLEGWSAVLENRDAWIQWLRVNGYLDNFSMLKASVEKVSKDLGYQAASFDFQLADQDRSWESQDITEEILQQFSKHDSENPQTTEFPILPLFCIAIYLRLYDEIHNGNKDWQVILNLLRRAKNSLKPRNAGILTVVLLASLKTEEIYSISRRDINKWRIQTRSAALVID